MTNEGSDKSFFPSLAVITVFYNQENWVDSYFQSFLDVFGELPATFYVGDNASDDFTVSKIKNWTEKYPQKIKFYEFSENHGFAKGNNLLVKKSDSKEILFLNPDVNFKNDFVTKCLDCLSRHGGIVSPVLVSETGELYPNFSPFYDRTFFLLHKLLYKFFPVFDYQKVDWIQGAVLFVKRNEFMQVGGWSEDYFLYTEDMDLCKKYAEEGRVRQILASVFVTHPKTDISEHQFELICKNLNIYFRNRSKFGYFVYLWFKSICSKKDRKQFALFKTLCDGNIDD